MTVEVNPSAKIQVRRLGDLMSPAVCSVCGFGGVERVYVDPALWIDYYGQVYFCDFCAVELGESIGMGTHEEFTHLKALYEQMQAKFQAQEAELNELRNLRDVISRISVLGDTSSPTPSVVEGTIVASESDTNDDTVNANDAGTGTDESSEPTESGTDSGPNDSARPTSSNGSRKPVRRSII